MSERQKQFVADKIIQTSNADKKIIILMSALQKAVHEKYDSLNDNDFLLIWDKFKPEAYLSHLKYLYCKHFDLDELNKILSFWLSIPGQNLIRGKFSESEMQLGLTWGSDFDAECQKIINKDSSNDHEIKFG